MSSVPDDDYLCLMMTISRKKHCFSLAGEGSRGKVRKRMFAGVVSTTHGEQQQQEADPSVGADAVCSENGRN